MLVANYGPAGNNSAYLSTFYNEIPYIMYNFSAPVMAVNTGFGYYPLYSSIINYVNRII